MTALSIERKPRKLAEHTLVNVLVLPVKAKTFLWAGAIACIDAGYIVPGATATGLIAVGIVWKTVDNRDFPGKPSTDGGKLVEIRQGTFECFNSTADPIGPADLGKIAYVEDDQTVAKTDGAGMRSRAGVILRVDPDAKMVWVQFALGL